MSGMNTVALGLVVGALVVGLLECFFGYRIFKILLALLGAAIGGALGVAIAMGTLTFSRRVMHTVGNGIAKIGSYEALLAVLSMAIVTHVYAMVGVPVSTAHGVIGALLGLGFVQGMQVIHWRVLARVALAWLATPLLAAALAAALYVVEHLTYTR